MRRGALLIGLIFTFSSSIQSQSQFIIPKKEQKADTYFEQKSFVKAERLYLKLLSSDQPNKRVELKLARTYFKDDRLELAYTYYSGVIHARYLVTSSDYLDYARTLIAKEKFDSAAWWTEKYLAIDPINQDAQNMLYQLTSWNFRDNPEPSKSQPESSQLTTAQALKGTLLKLNSGSFVKSYVITDYGVIEVMRSSAQLEIAWLDQLLKENNIIITDHVNINPVIYDPGQASLNDGHKSELDKLADLMEKYKMVEFEISGHSDSSGPEEYNRQLSQLRAGAARDYLMTRDIQTRRLLAIGYGESKPVAVENDKSEHRQNRRLEFRLVHLNDDRMISTY